MTIRLTHFNLITLGKRLGYEQMERGLCQGFSGMFAQAVLAEDESPFWARLKLIEAYTDYDYLVADIKKIQTKVKKQQKLNEHEKKLLEIQAFFDGVMLYLQPSNFIDLFNERLNHTDLNKIYPIAKSTNLENSTISLALDTTYAFNRDNFTDFIQNLEAQLRLNAFPNTPILLGSDNHTVCVKYDPSNQEQPWLLVDTNGLRLINLSESNHTYYASNNNEFVDSVFNALTENENLVVSITVLSKEIQPRPLEISLDEPNISAYNSSGAGLLYITCQQGHTEKVKALLEKDGIDVNKARADGTTPLYIACQNGHTEIVKALLEKDGIDVNNARTEGDTPLYIACHNGHTEIVKALLEKDGIDVNKALTEGATALYAACQQGHTEIVKALLEKDGIDVNKALAEGITPLYAACHNGHTAIVKALLEKDGIDVNNARASGDTPLYAACQNGHTAIVKALLEKDGIDVNNARENGATALYIACQNGHTEIVKALLEKNGIDVNKAFTEETTPLYIACQYGHTEIVKALLEKDGIDVNKARASGDTPLYAACHNGHTEIVKALLEKDGIDVNKARASGDTPLYAACQKNQFEIVQLFLVDALSGLDESIDSQKHRPAFHESLLHLRSEIVNELFSELRLRSRRHLNIKVIVNGYTKEVINNVTNLIHTINTEVDPSAKLIAIQNCRSALYPMKIPKHIGKALLSVFIAATAAVAFMSVAPIGAAAAIGAVTIAAGVGLLVSYGLFRKNPLDKAIDACLNNALIEPIHHLPQTQFGLEIR